MDLKVLKQRKKELGLTNFELARISGVSLGTINKIFSGATKSPQMQTLDALIEALGLNTYHYEPNPEPHYVREADPVYHISPNENSYTIADIDHLPDGVRAELIDGQIYYMAAPNRIHQKITFSLARKIADYIDTHHGTCEVYPGPFHVEWEEDDRNHVEPDISVICDPSKLTDRGCLGSPDWIIEVVSPSNRQMDYLIKLNKYWANGVREYWIIDPQEKQIWVYQFSGIDHKFLTRSYTFQDKVKVGIYEDLEINFMEFKI